MEQQDKIRFLLSMQEHPEQYTVEQLQQMIADDPELAEQLEQLALTKQAFVKQEADEEAILVEDEWKKFAAEHAEELEALEKDEPHTANIKKLMGILPYKVAASIIGILFTAGVAFAAIHIARMVSHSKPQTIQTEQTISDKPISALPTDTIKTDTTTNTKPVRQLRFYFVWKQDETLDIVLHRLNLFESITIELKDNKIIVE